MPDEKEKDKNPKEDTNQPESKEDEAEGSGGEEEKQEDKYVNPDDYEVETVEPEEEKEPELDEDIDEEDANVINKVVESRVKPLQSQLEQTRTEAEVDRFIADNPDFKRYRDVILKYKTTPNSAYRNIPAGRIARMVAYEDAQKQGAKKERETQTKVNKTKGGGSGARETQSGEIDWQGMSKEEFQKKKAEMLGHR